MYKSGIYMIVSSIKPERIYIGSAVNLSQRKADHFSTLRRGIHHSPKLLNHVNKYGVDDLVFTVIDRCPKEDLLQKEQYYIDTLHPYFNCLLIAGSPIGYKHSEETKRKIGLAHKGRKLSEESKELIRQARLGTKATPEARLKMSISRKGNKNSLGTKHSAEVRAGWSKQRIGNTNGRFLKGIKRSEETKQRMSEARKKWWLNKHKAA